jgi:transposase
VDNLFPFSQFINRFATEEICLEEIKRYRYPNGIRCLVCNKITTHYKVEGRTAYCCKICRTQIYPLKGTIFEKTSTPLRLWFYCMFLMTQTRADLSVRELQHELGVTYKTAWRMYTSIKTLMQQSGEDLLVKSDEEGHKVRRWTFFDKLEITFVEKRTTEDS